jgi:hypothetical protein
MNRVFGLQSISIGTLHEERDVLIVGAGSISDVTILSLEMAAKKIRDEVFIITPDTIEKFTAHVNLPLEDLLTLLESTKVKVLNRTDFEDICLKASEHFKDFTKEVSLISRQDNRPFYQRLHDKGGKKRKQNFKNKQPRRN